jgi:nitrogen-specific signal transduction histidine kinase
MRCAILTVDGTGRVLTINAMAREILEIEGPIEPGRPVEDVLAAHPRLAEVLRDSLEMSYLPNRAELEIRSRDDDGRTIGFTISPIIGERGPSGLALFFKDLTQVERQEEQDRLRDRLAALGQMAASLAHEIRNPLASIDVTATLLKRRLASRDEDLRLAEKIVDEVERLNRTVTRGLEFARAITPERVRQPLAPLLDEALEEARSRFAAPWLVVERRYDPGAPRAPVDAHLMRQVFVNLIANAIEAMGDAGTLTLAVHPVSRPDRAPVAVELVVRDTGPGIPAEVREKIFYPFVTTKKSGSGIGLAMARKIVECHHGRIDVESGPESGTAFRLRLPCDDDGR